MRVDRIEGVGTNIGTGPDSGGLQVLGLMQKVWGANPSRKEKGAWLH